MVLKKIINTVISTVLMGSFVLGNVSIVGGGMTAAAANNYDPLDVNRDNKVNVADVVYLNMYLAGKNSITDYNRFDVNNSLTIDAADSNCILAKVAMTTYSSAYFSRKTNKTVPYSDVSEVTLDPSIYLTDSRKYRRYSYARSKELANYTLSADTYTFPEDISGQISPASISDGEDTRYVAYGEENTGIVRISSVGGTGFIVGDHQIATAAHCVYNAGTKKWCPMTINTYDSNGNITNTTLTPVEAHMPYEFDGKKATYDYALITVSEDLSDYVHFSLGTYYNLTSFAGIPIYITGSPDSTASGTNPNTSNKLYSDEGNMCAISGDESIFLCGTFSSGGDSGSPIYTITRNVIDGKVSYVYTAIAVLCGVAPNLASLGPSITKYQLKFYHNNEYMSY